MGRKVTIEDIARQSGASRTTVSLVLRNKPGIGSETRERVHAAAQALGYRQRSPAPIEIGQSVLNIALILRSRNRYREGQILPGVNAFYSWVLAGVEAAARQQRINLLYSTLPVDHTNEPIEFPAHLLDQRLDGMLLVGSFSESTIAEVQRRGASALVLLDASAGIHRFDAIVSDNQAGAYIAVSYLIAHGHRKIAFVSPDSAADPNFEQRRLGYLAALREHRLDPWYCRMTKDDAATPIAELLRRHPDLTALFGCNDVYTINAM